MSEPTLVLFDMDGTLVDSQHMIVAALTAAFESESLDLPDRKTMLSVVGLSLVEAMARLVASDHAQHERLAGAYREAFQTLRRQEDSREPLFPGAPETISRFAARDDLILGIATGKSRRGVDHVLQRYDWHAHFVSIQTADDHPSKPHPSMVTTAMSECGIPAERTFVIGDTVFDMEMARSAGARGIGVSWGYHDTEHLRPAGASLVIDDFSALDEAIASLSGEHRETAT
ncbi:HAD-IA family hydrolase [Tepidamorphus sp. 3E244]|uniref:HAD-IA family hydrolase n=1 Tax=Tepidamorphus sp. 3E244 TaxID=3385498 RepID=UPI0038FC83B9